MNALTDFTALSQGAAYCAQWGGSFVLYVNGQVDDSYDTLEVAADMLVDCWGDWHEVKVLEFAPSGASTDVTADAKRLVEGWCHNRHQLAPWEEEA